MSKTESVNHHEYNFSQEETKEIIDYAHPLCIEMMKTVGRSDREKCAELMGKMYEDWGHDAPTEVHWFEDPWETKAAFIAHEVKAGRCTESNSEAHWRECRNMGTLDVARVAFCQYCTEHEPERFADVDKLYSLIELSKQTGPFATSPGVAWMTDLPKSTAVNPECCKTKEDSIYYLNFHNPEGAAIEWHNGKVWCCIDELEVPPHWVMPDMERPTAQEVLTHEDMSLRIIGIELLGWPAILAELDYTVIDKNEDPDVGTLIEASFEGPQGDIPARFIMSECPVNGQIAYQVKPTTKTAMEGKLFSYGITLEEENIMEFRS